MVLETHQFYLLDITPQEKEKTVKDHIKSPCKKCQHYDEYCITTLRVVSTCKKSGIFFKSCNKFKSTSGVVDCC
jgi:hypothetical protein